MVEALLTGAGSFTAKSDRRAWLRAQVSTGTTGWTGRRRWSTFGSEVDAPVVFSDDSFHGPILSVSDGGQGANRMYRLIHTGTLSLAGATQLHVRWFFMAGQGLGSGLSVKLILDGVTYTSASTTTVDGLSRTTFNINPTASVNTVAVQWENNSSPIYQAFLDEIARTPAVKTAPSRDAPLTGSGQFTATTQVVGAAPNAGALLTGSGAFTATVLTGGVEQASAFLAGSGEFTATVRERPSGHVFGDVQTATATVLDGTASVPVPSYLLIVDPELDETPSVLDVRVANVEPLAEVTFAIDGVDIGTEIADVQGDILALSLDVARDVLAGPHTLTATTAGTVAQAEFTVASAPISLPPTQDPDAPPVLVGGSTGPNGVYRWVLQDLTPGGIGSWVMPINPSSMANPHVRKTVAATSTTAVHGQPHVSEGATPVEWEFAGFAPDQEFQDKLLAYAGLRYRFYLIDHRNRAWIVSFASVDLVPRKRTHNDLGQPSDWLADYTVRAVLYSQTPQEVTA